MCERGGGGEAPRAKQPVRVAGGESSLLPENETKTTNSNVHTSRLHPVSTETVGPSP